MADLSREEHRKRVRDKYMINGAQGMNDQDLLELLLFYAIPRRDVKPVSYNLMNYFGTLENIFNADVDTLKIVAGIGENSAILISLFGDIRKRISERRNENCKRISTSEEGMDYAKNLLCECSNERLLLVSLDNSNNILKTHIVSEGGVNYSMADTKPVVEFVIKDSASAVVFMHNHPNSSPLPSQDDINFTVEMLSLLRRLKIKINDHIIVGKNSVYSMRRDERFSAYFK